MKPGLDILIIVWTCQRIPTNKKNEEASIMNSMERLSAKCAKLTQYIFCFLFGNSTMLRIGTKKNEDVVAGNGKRVLSFVRLKP